MPDELQQIKRVPQVFEHPNLPIEGLIESIVQDFQAVEHVRLFKFSKGIDCGEVWASDLKTRKESIRWDRDMSIKEGWENLDEIYKYHRKVPIATLRASS
jgi:hypothetical protein